MAEKTKLLISSDHGGFKLKENLEYYFDVASGDPLSEIIDFEDLGPHDYVEADDYPQFAFDLSQKLLENLKTKEEIDGYQQLLGVLICRSGNGMSIAANKVKGIRAALCFNTEHAIKARQHNHANVLVLDADYHEGSEAREIVKAFVQTQPEGGRHQRRVEQITEFENKYL